MPNLISAIAVNGSNLATYGDYINTVSAANAVTAATGGMLNTVDFRSYTMPVVSDATLPSKVAENANKPVVDATVNVATLQVDMFALFRQVSRQLELNRDPAGLATEIVSGATVNFPRAFDVEALGTIAGGANLNTSVEYDAADPIGSMSAWLAPYDNTSYQADAVVLTPAGARKLRFAQDTQARLQSDGGVAGVLGVPAFVTRATPTQLGDATLLGIAGPWSAGVVGTALGVTVDRMDQATVNSKGPEQNIVNYRVEAAWGYANGIDYDNTGRGFTLLIDAV